MALLTVVVPVYNEAKTILQILEKINRLSLDTEIIVVDNCSTDGTQAVLHELQKKTDFYHTRVIYHSYNRGKGDSVREGIELARGEYVVIQDADLEYDPSEYCALMKPVQENRADLVLGARFTKGHDGLLLHRWGNRLLTGLINLLFAVRLNDYATCYKLARKSLFLELGLKAHSFDIEVEIVCRALKKKKRIEEVPIAYSPRSYAEGKKIRWVDGMHAIISIVKHRIAP